MNLDLRNRSRLLNSGQVAVQRIGNAVTKQFPEPGRKMPKAQLAHN